MGGGTTVVEALRLGCHVIGIDLNPVAWFIVKTEIEPVDLDILKAAFDRLAAQPVAWNDGRPLNETFSACTRQKFPRVPKPTSSTHFGSSRLSARTQTVGARCRSLRITFIAQKSPKIRYHRDAMCPVCRKTFDWEVELASLIAEPAFMVNAPRGSAGEGRPNIAMELRT